jgi:hypothetical protein
MHAKIAFASIFNLDEREDLVEGTMVDSSYLPLWIMPRCTARRRAHERRHRSPHCLGRDSHCRRLPFDALVGRRQRIGRRSRCGCHRAPPARVRCLHHCLEPDAGGSLYDREKADETAAAELHRLRELETGEEEMFSALLATKPATKAGAIACVKHVADCGLATDEMRRWLAMLVESPLVS